MVFRRRKPLHEQLAEGTELLQWEPKYEPVRPFQGTLDVLHGGRPRRWDVVVTAEAPALTGDAVEFVALPDGVLVVDDAVPEGALEPLALAVEKELERPYRAEGVRRTESVWAVAANRIVVVELPEDIPGDELELSVQAGERALLVDGAPSLAYLETLEAYARERHADYVARAERLDGTLWEVRLSPL